MQRVDPLNTVHKALRSMLYEMGNLIQKSDFTDGAVARDVFSQLQGALGFLDEHAQDEERFYFPSLKDQEPEMVARLEREHREIERQGDRIMSMKEEIDPRKSCEELIAAGDRLNRLFNDFLEYSLAHFNYEELETLPASWEHLTDEELQAILVAIRSNKPPERAAAWAALFFKAINDHELSEMIAGMKTSGIPAQAQDAVIALARDIVGEERWRNLQVKVAS